MAKRKKKKSRWFFVLILILIILGLGYYLLSNKNNINLESPSFPKIEKKLKIVDEDSKSRPYAVMINNNHAALPHAGLQDAYISYEVLAEGGITRIMALFKDQNTAKIGSVRSARPYFLDYALENDAIYVHYGWSDQAKADISSLGVDNINGLTHDGAFWRDTSLKKATEHTVFTSMDKLKTYAKKLGYDRDTNKDLLLNYSVERVDLSKNENAQEAKNVYMKYSYYTDTSYEYDKDNKVYKRSMSGKPHVDAVTGNQYTYKNIIITPIKASAYDSYGRLNLSDIGSGEGYYITEGYAIPIKWSKSSRSSQTLYTDLEGNEVKVNDGNTFIQITPPGETITIQGENPDNEA